MRYPRKNIPCIVKKCGGEKIPFFDDLILLLLKQKRIEEDIDVEWKTMNFLATQLHSCPFPSELIDIKMLVGEENSSGLFIHNFATRAIKFCNMVKSFSAFTMVRATSKNQNILCFFIIRENCKNFCTQCRLGKNIISAYSPIVGASSKRQRGEV